MQRRIFMNKRLVWLAMLLSVVMIVSGCGDKTEGGANVSQAIGTYYLSQGTGSVNGEVVEVYSPSAHGEDYFVLKLCDGNKYFLKWGGAVASGEFRLEGGVLDLYGAEQLYASADTQFAEGSFSVNGESIDSYMRFNSQDNRVEFSVTLTRGENVDDSFFDSVGGSDKENEPLPVAPDELEKAAGLEEGYLPNEFKPENITLSFRWGNNVEEILLTDTNFSVNENGGKGKVTVNYLGKEFSFEYNIVTVPDNFEFADVTAEYSEDGIIHTPALPEGFRFEALTETGFVEIGNHFVEGYVYYGDRQLGYLSSTLTIIPKKLPELPEQITVTAEGELTRLPSDAVDGEYFELSHTEFERGSTEVLVYLKNSNYAFSDGSTEPKSIIVTVEAPRLSADNFVWVIPEQTVVFGYDWQYRMPYLEVNGARLEGVIYSYGGQEDFDGEMFDKEENGFPDIGNYTVTADFSRAAYMPDGEIQECVITLAPLVLPEIETVEKVYTGYYTDALPNWAYEGYVEYGGEYGATSVGSYSYEMWIPSHFAGAVTFSDGSTDLKTVNWSIAKGTVILTVNTSQFDKGLSFEYDGQSRYINASTNSSVVPVIYINGERIDYPNDYSLSMPGTYNVRVAVEHDTVTAEPYEFTVNISKKKIYLSEEVYEWQGGEFTYNGSSQAIYLQTKPEYVEVSYEANTAVDAGKYTARAILSVNLDYYYNGATVGELYEILDQGYTIEHQWEIARIAVERPELPSSTSFVYNINKQYIIKDLPHYISATGNCATDAGEYVAILTLDKNYMYSDGSAEDIRIEWSITPQEITLSEITHTDAVYEYGGTHYHSISYGNHYYYYDIVSIEGEYEVMNPGTHKYTLSFTMRDSYKNNPNYTLVDHMGNTAEESFTYTSTIKINKYVLTTPYVPENLNYTYTGSIITPTVYNYSESLMEIVGNDDINAGVHTFTVKILDSSFYTFKLADGTEVDSVEVSFNVNKAHLNYPYYTSPITSYDGVSYEVTGVYTGVRGETFPATVEIRRNDSVVSSICNAGEYTLTFTLEADGDWMLNYNDPGITSQTFKVNKAYFNIDSLVWSGDSAVYDGNIHIPTVTGYPDEVGAPTYTDSQGNAIEYTDVSTFYVYARFAETENYFAREASHKFEITRRPVELPTVKKTSFVYTGEQFVIEWSCVDSEFGEYVAYVSSSSAVNAGSYTATFSAGWNFAWVDESGAEFTTYSVDWTIEKATYDLSALGWTGENGATYKSNGTVYGFELTGLPKPLEVTYSFAGSQAPGSYTNTATVTNGDPANWNDPVIDPSLLTISFTVEGDIFGDYEYYVDESLAYITKYIGTGSRVTLPEDINGISIAWIGSIFKGNEDIVELDLSAVADNYDFAVPEGGLAGMDNLRILHAPRIGNRSGQTVMLSYYFGSQNDIPKTLESLYLDSVWGSEFYFTYIDCPTIRELHLVTSAHIDVRSTLLQLDYCEIEGQRSDQEIVGANAFIGVVFPHSGDFRWTLQYIGSHFENNIDDYLRFKTSTSSIYAIDDILYQLTPDNTARVLFVRSMENVVIPESINVNGTEYTVTEIFGGSMQNNTVIKSITVPKGIETVGSNAFSGLDSLEQIIWNARNVTSFASDSSLKLTRRGTITIGEGVESIPDGFMKESYGLLSVTLPSSVRTVGKSAFSMCYNLRSVALSENLESVGSSAFCYSYKLADVYNPSALVYGTDFSIYLYDGMVINVFTEAGGAASVTDENGFIFYDDGTTVWLLDYAGDKSDITLPDSYKGKAYTLTRCAFSYHNGISSVVIGDGCPVLTDEAFMGCEKLESVSLSFSVKQIHNRVFKDCVSLKEISVPNSVDTLHTQVFEGCTSLRVASIMATVTELEQYMFHNCTALTTVSLPSELVSIDVYAFSGCSALEIISIPNTVTSIGKYAFTSSALKSITLPDGLTVISDSLFSGCNKLTELILSNNITSIGDGAFKDCIQLTLTALPKNIKHIGYQAFSGTNICTADANGFITFDNWVIGYEGADAVDLILPLKIVGIADQAFSQNEYIISAVLPQGLLYIGESAFNGCYNMESLSIPSALEIGAGAFSGCTNISKLELPDGLLVIGDSAFYSLSGITELKLPSSLLVLGDSAFYGCENIEGTVAIPAAVTEIGYRVFQNCQKISRIEFYSANAVADIYYGEDIFGEVGAEVDGGTTLFIGKEITEITDRYFAFGYFTSVVFEDGSKLKNIGEQAFYDCQNLTVVRFAEGTALDVLGYRAFANCVALKSVENLAAVVIGSSAFGNCSSLESIYIADITEMVGSYAFSSCTALTDITFATADGWTKTVDGEEIQVSLETAEERLALLVTDCTEVKRATAG